MELLDSVLPGSKKKIQLFQNFPAVLSWEFNAKKKKKKVDNFTNNFTK